MSEKIRICNTYLSEPAARRLDQITARMLTEVGRNSGRNGGWSSQVIEAALLSLDDATVDRIIAEKRERKAA